MDLSTLHGLAAELRARAWGATPAEQTDLLFLAKEYERLSGENPTNEPGSIPVLLPK